MPHFNEYSSAGRTLMVKFTCRRCGKIHTEPLEAHKDDDKDSYGYLRFIDPPKGWHNLPHGPLLCPECIDAYDRFMCGEKEGKI